MGVGRIITDPAALAGCKELNTHGTDFTEHPADQS
jgi:hypothetical protein